MDLLLAENAYSVDLMRRLRLLGQVLESGYPRNDILTADTGSAMRSSCDRCSAFGPINRCCYAPWERPMDLHLTSWI